MTHTKPMDESKGEFKKAKASERPCQKCGGKNVTVKEWDSSDGAYTDYKYTCGDCGHVRWIDGPDS